MYRRAPDLDCSFFLSFLLSFLFSSFLLPSFLPFFLLFFFPFSLSFFLYFLFSPPPSSSRSSHASPRHTEKQTSGLFCFRAPSFAEPPPKCQGLGLLGQPPNGIGPFVYICTCTYTRADSGYTERERERERKRERGRKRGRKRNRKSTQHTPSPSVLTLECGSHGKRNVLGGCVRGLRMYVCMYVLTCEKEKERRRREGSFVSFVCTYIIHTYVCTCMYYTLLDIFRSGQIPVLLCDARFHVWGPFLAHQ